MRVDAKCVAHGNRRCTWCSLNPADCGSCEHGSCAVYVDDGMHWDTCQNRVRGPEDARKRGLWPAAVPFPELGEGADGLPVLASTPEVVARLRELRPAPEWWRTLGDDELAEALARQVGAAIYEKVKEFPAPPPRAPWEPPPMPGLYPGVHKVDVGAVAAKAVLDVLVDLSPWRRRRAGLRGLADQVRRVTEWASSER